jgi:hypothetical protein
MAPGDEEAEGASTTILAIHHSMLILLSIRGIVDVV